VTAIVLGTVSTLVLLYCGPTIQVDILKHDLAEVSKQWWYFPLKNPCLITMTLSFLSGIVVSLLKPEPAAEAGFAEVEEETRTVPWTWPGTVEEVWEYGQSISVPFRSLLERVPRHEWERVNADVHAAIREYWDGSSVNFGAVLVFGSGKKL